MKRSWSSETNSSSYKQLNHRAVATSLISGSVLEVYLLPPHVFLFIMATYDTAIASQAEKAKALLQKYIDAKEVVVVKKRNCERTQSQNNYLYYILSFFADETGYSKDEVKMYFFKRRCNPDIFYRTKINKRGTEISYLRSTKELTKEEMSLAISRFRNWSAMPPVGIYIPSPDDKDFTRYCETRLQNDEEYNV